MKLKFEFLSRAFLFLWVSIFLWSFWVYGQGEPLATNTVATNIVAEVDGEKSNALLKLPGAILLEKETSLTFGLDKIESLQPPIWGTTGNPRWKFVAFGIYVLLAILASKIVQYIFSAWLKKLTERTKTKLDDMLLLLLQGPVKVISFVILVHIGLNIFHWGPSFRIYLSKGLLVIVAFSLTYMALKAIELGLHFWEEKNHRNEAKRYDAQLFPLIETSLKIIVVIVASLLTFDNLGLNVRSVIATLSIGSLALGLAAQDTLANLFGAVSIFVDKPCRVGDVVKVDSVEGKVESIGLRSTRIRNADGHLVAIPNKTMGNATITNIARRSAIRSVINIGLSYETSLEKTEEAVRILEEIYQANPLTSDLLISFNKFGDSAMNIQIIHHWKNDDAREQLMGMHAFNLEIKKRFEQAAIQFAFPSQTLYLRQDSDWKLTQARGEPN